MEVKVKIEKTLHTDNDKVFYEDEDIAFEMEKPVISILAGLRKSRRNQLLLMIS